MTSNPDGFAEFLAQSTSTPVIDLVCPHCGGTSWRQREHISRPGRWSFTCDDCATKREARQPEPAPALDWRACAEKITKQRDDALRERDAALTKIETLELKIARLLAPEH